MSTTSYFKQTNTFITTNLSLRKPQRLAHKKLKESFKGENFSHKLIVLPTGTGKTGLMGIAPFDISDGRVLIVTPSLVIREGISDEFDTRTQFNFWTERNVIINDDHLPTVYRYAGHSGTAGDKARVRKYLENANIVIANIHKVYSSTSTKTLTKMLDPDFFDMIIIDEAHHSAAESWQKTLEHFNAKKIVKLTATPTRNDYKEIEGELVYEYSMADAINNKYIKNVMTEDYTTEKLHFVVNGEEVDKETALDLMDKKWVSRSVAYSLECSRTIVAMSIEKLKEKRQNGNAHHQIIAVACSVEHAKQIMELYQEFGYRADYVTSERPTEECEKVIVEFKKAQIDVLVNVNMLGEGFDHPNISIAAIFRPFRSLPPYAQFIGRALRRIQGENMIDEVDNVAHVVYHKELDLDSLWDYYTGQKTKARIREAIEREYHEQFPSRDVGEIRTEGAVVSTTREFLSDGIGLKYKGTLQQIIRDREKQWEDTAAGMRNIGIPEEQITDFIKLQKQKLEGEITARQDKLREELIREELHEAHKEHIAQMVEALFEQTGIDPKGVELPNNTTSAIYKSTKTNDGYIMRYIHTNLKQKLKRGIDEWETYDFEQARSTLPVIIQKLKEKIERIDD
ncbi:DEAD/DEAH box helicase [Bacillus songklensis]|uniref:DEAD/DEAH box helicase n=1 Tax=Bacillus songklensis TaxID=1069116 RepID=A0ABV8B0G1_9BACI